MFVLRKIKIFQKYRVSLVLILICDKHTYFSYFSYIWFKYKFAALRGYSGDYLFSAILCNCFEMPAKCSSVSVYLETVDTFRHDCLVEEETSVTTEITFHRRCRHILYVELYHTVFAVSLLFLYTRATPFYSVHEQRTSSKDFNVLLSPRISIPVEYNIRSIWERKRGTFEKLRRQKYDCAKGEGNVGGGKAGFRVENQYRKSGEFSGISCEQQLLIKWDIISIRRKVSRPTYSPAMSEIKARPAADVTVPY